MSWCVGSGGGDEGGLPSGRTSPTGRDRYHRGIVHIGYVDGHLYAVHGARRVGGGQHHTVTALRLIVQGAFVFNWPLFLDMSKDAASGPPRGVDQRRPPVYRGPASDGVDTRVRVVQALGRRLASSMNRNSRWGRSSGTT